MKNIEQWRPSKYVFHKGKLQGSRNIAEVGLSSRLITDLVARRYDKYLPEYAVGDLLDLGCGRVPLFEAYRPYVTSNTCIDWGNTYHEASHLDITCDINGDLPLPDASFDTIILSDVLEHIARPEKLCNEIARVLKSGGIAFINTPFMYWLHEVPYDYHRYTEYALRRLADINNLEVVVLEPIGGAFEVLADIMAKTVVNWPFIGQPLASFVQKASAEVNKTKKGQRFSKKTAQNMPLFYFMIVRKH